MNIRRFFQGTEIKKGKPFPQVLSRRALPLVIVASLLASLVGAVGLPATVSAQHQGEETANYLPPDTVLYLTVNFDLEEEQLANFWRVVNNWWGDPNVKVKWGEWMDQAEEESSIDVENDILPWLGPEIAMGMRNITAQYPEEPEILVFIGTMDKAASDAAFEKYKAWRVEESGLAFSSYSYRNQDIVVGDNQEYYGFTDEYILFSNNEDAIHRTIDFILEGGDSLANTTNFQAAQAVLPERAGVFYYNFEAFWNEIAQIIPKEELGISQQTVQDLIAASNRLTPSYFAASLQFTETGITTTAYYPLPEGVTFPTTEAAQLKTTNIVPGDALFFASEDTSASWKASKSYLEAAWSEAISLVTYPLSKVPEEIIALLNENLGLDKDVEAIWAEDIAPHLGELAGMSPEEAITYLDETFQLNLEEAWAEIAPNLGELSGMSFEQAIARLSETLGLDETWEEEIVPHLSELSGKSYQEAIVYLLNLEEQWGEITTHLGALSTKSLEETIEYFLNEIANESFEEAIARFDEAMAEVLGESTIALLPLSSVEEAPDILLIFEVSDVTKAQEYLDTVIEIVKLLAPVQVSEQSIDGVTATIIKNDALLEVGASPGYLFLDVDDTHYLVIGSTQESLEAVVNAKNDPAKSLSQAEEYQGLLSQLGEIKGSLIYFNLTSILDTMVSEGQKDELARVQEAVTRMMEDNNLTEIQGVQTPTDDMSAFPDTTTTHGTAGVGWTIYECDRNGDGEYDPWNLPSPYDRSYFWDKTTMWSYTCSNDGTVSQHGSEEWDWLFDCIPLKSALGYTCPIVGEGGVTMTGALYLLPPPLIEQAIEDGFSGSISVPEQTFDLSYLDPDVGEAAVQIDVDIIDAPADASINVTAMKDPPEDVRSGFELAATDANLTIMDIAYVVRVDKTNLTSDNIGTATITLEVGKAWVDEYGTDNVRIFRIGDDGTKEVLPTEFKGYEGDQAIFEGISESGLSYFGLVAVSVGGIRWALIGGIIGGVVVVVAILTIVTLLWRRRRAQPSIISS